MKDLKTPKRKFLLGEEWLYFRIYLGPKTTDDFLIEVVLPITDQLFDEELIYKWFFIRYLDPDPHVRLRLRLMGNTKIDELIKIFNPFFREYMDDDILWKVEIGTYEREIERYGIETIELSEELFFVDSFTIVRILRELVNSEDENIRWLVGLKIVDSILEGFNYQEQQKLNIIRELKNGFAVEFGFDKDLKIQLDKKYRKFSNKIEEILDPIKYEYSIPFQIKVELSDYAEKLQTIALKMSRIIETRPNGQFDNRMGSFLHMSLNRLFISKNRLNEFVTYYFLDRFYTSSIARKKYHKAN